MTTFELLRNRKAHIGVVGLGYVGRPLAVALNRKFSVYGFDTDDTLVRTLRSGLDATRSVNNSELRGVSDRFTSDPAVLRHCSVIIISVPTPINRDRTPDLGSLKAASRTVGRNLPAGCVVVVESTVYPGVTEEVVAPIVAHESGREVGRGFHVGYSPERISPGDDSHTLDRLVKVVAGGDYRVTELIAAVYGAVTRSGVYRAASIKTAEMAKVIENTQRDLNIALMNELAMICDRLSLDTADVIEAAATKWNFARFEPGLVGGHCIGVDPYYLTHVAENAGHNPHVILAGRRVNDSMGRYVAQRTIELLRPSGNGRRTEVPSVLILGFTFKENIADVRNTRVADVLHHLQETGVKCSVFDPEADPRHIREDYGFNVLSDVQHGAPYDAVVVAVRHDVFRSSFPLETIKSLSVCDRPVLIDVKGIYDRNAARDSGFLYWRL